MASGQLTLDMPDPAEAAGALAQQARGTAELADALDRDLAARGATELLAEVEWEAGVAARATPVRFADVLQEAAERLGDLVRQSDA